MAVLPDLAPRTADRVWLTVRRHPVRVLASSLPWRSLLYLAVGVPVGVLCLGVIVLLSAMGVLLLPVVLGVVPLLLLCLLGIPIARVERARLRWFEGDPTPSPHRAVAAQGLYSGARTRLREPMTWQELAYAVVVAVLWWVLDLVVVVVAVLTPGAMMLAPLLVSVLPPKVVPAGHAMGDSGLIWMTVPLGLVAALLAGYLVCLAAAVRAGLARAMLVPARVAPSLELVEVRRSRARMLDQYEAERRRIERDLHDGAQQRLTSLAMLLGLATIQLGHDGQLGHGSEQDSPAWLVARAHDEAKLALAELQELIRGVHPKILTDRGLDAALGELADRCAIPVHLDTVVGRRLSDLVESTAYYAVSEALANVVKHSGAARAEVIARYSDGELCVEIRDDGRGGADPANGDGLTGLADRAAAVGGTLAVASPQGGPTVLRVSIPGVPRQGLDDAGTGQ